MWLKIALNAVRLPKFGPVNGISWSPRKIMVKGLRQRSGLAWFCACAESCVVFNTGPYTVLLDNSILKPTANMQSETGFPFSHQLKSYTSPLSPAWNWRRAVLSADAGLLVHSTAGTDRLNIRAAFLDTVVSFFVSIYAFISINSACKSTR